MRISVLLLFSMVVTLVGKTYALSVKDFRNIQRELAYRKLYVHYSHPISDLAGKQRLETMQILKGLLGMVRTEQFRQNLAPACPILSFGSSAHAGAREGENHWYDPKWKWLHVGTNSNNSSDTLRSLANLLFKHCLLKQNSSERERTSTQLKTASRFFELNLKQVYDLEVTSLLESKNRLKQYSDFLKRLFFDVLRPESRLTSRISENTRVFIFVREQKEIGRTLSSEVPQYISLNLTPTMSSIEIKNALEGQLGVKKL